MKKQFSFFMAAIMLFLTSNMQTINAQEVITSWDFENGTPFPVTGNGSIFLIGGTFIQWGRTGVDAGTATPDGIKEDSAMRAGTAFHTYNYPAQGTNPRTAGLHLNLSTVGYKNILLSADVRQGGTSANKLVLLYTVDGNNWNRAITYTTDTNDAWYLRNYNFSNIAEANNNPLFAVRFVTNFDDDVEDQEVYVPVRKRNEYDPNGSIRYDNIILRGYPLNSPEDDRTPFVEWTFDEQNFNPAFGLGSLQLIGGVQYETEWTREGIIRNQTIHDQGVYDYKAVKEGYGLQTFTYPVSGNNKTAGIQININTRNYKDLYLTADIRQGNTAANKITLQYSIDGSSWVDAITYTSNSGDTWYKRSYDFSTVSEAFDNPTFAVRYVTTLDGTEYVATGLDKEYLPTGPIRFDNIVFSGRVITSATGIEPNAVYIHVSNKTLHFSEEPAGVVRIYSVSGVQVAEFTQKTSINLENLNSGVYIVSFNNQHAKIILN
jgi:hypothetical protein